MDCETCKEKRRVVVQTPKDVPYIAHESAVARLERIIKRLWVLALVLIVLLAASNAAWIWYCNQWETVESWEITQENDGGYNNYIGNDGDIVNGYLLCWRYQKAKGITKKRAAPVKRCCPFYLCQRFQNVCDYINCPSVADCFNSCTFRNAIGISGRKCLQFLCFVCCQIPPL